MIARWLIAFILGYFTIEFVDWAEDIKGEVEELRWVIEKTKDG